MTGHAYVGTLQHVDVMDELRYLILAAQREGTRAFAASLRPHRLTPAQAEAVEVLAVAVRPLTVKELGERLVCEHGSPSRLVRTLADKGLVESSADDRDGRATRLRLTGEGRAAVTHVAEAKRELDAMVTSILDRSEAKRLCRLLRNLVGNLPSGRALARRLASEGPLSGAAVTTNEPGTPDLRIPRDAS